MNNRLWAVLAVDSFTSKTTNRLTYEIHMIGVQDQQRYKTYIDTKNRNYKNWMKVIATYKGGLIISELKSKPHDPYLIDADSKPNIVIDYKDYKKMESELEDWWGKSLSSLDKT
jgi:hypothetical protein